MSSSSLNRICRHREQDGGTARFHCVVPEDFFGFQGHFNGHPIMPGVCQLQLVVEAIAETEYPIRISRFERVKFHNLITPGTAFVISVETKGNDFLYQIYNETAAFASGKIVLR
ncbi:MAG: hypothetical protein JXX29_16545 [Deltaproteobacteria bacterium]|nr:hypothetical protein [Deltaproteobacteria bacterium]MBN2673294.1 hypothetical protein [Deltaproteobacteria bacterium]